MGYLFSGRAQAHPCVAARVVLARKLARIAFTLMRNEENFMK